MKGHIVEVSPSGYSEPATFDRPESREELLALSADALPVEVIDSSNVVIEFEEGDRLSVRIDKTPDELAVMNTADVIALVDAAFAEQQPQRVIGIHPAVGISVVEA